ncbi:hypothetical protein PCANC_28860 [Puccinia coronata f. sp. avenae]|uniref:Tet-like 2OG-Fe(II) oxygenase domain-containing protein n=1 Tax=Puccinia coronata f. sp. avenae TaxID=200324 RepID=A0A2N5RXN8_9BASI|nr:hypothetical protein PCANC_28860 [Puccinia coronata f. sp. avenae]PLW42674.1 hypothetical protein PCASD_08517 [Puccinia coronata f. sp. avenae]
MQTLGQSNLPGGMPTANPGQPTLPENNQKRRRPKKRPNANEKQEERRARKAMAPFVASGSLAVLPSHAPVSAVEEDPHNNEEVMDQDDNQPQEDTQKPHFYYVPPSCQDNPHKDKLFTCQETLDEHYHRLSFGTCIISPRNQVAFCKVQWIPFDSMSPAELTGWEKIVFHLLKRCEHVNPVKKNGSQTDGMMWADGWRKISDPDQSVGRFCLVGKMKNAMKRAQYNPISEAAGIQEASDFISLQLQKFAPGVFKSCRQLLIDSWFPSMAHMEYPSPYTENDFTSFLTFTMHNFYNKPHMDSDVNDWTLVIWIPIFNPLTRTEADPVMADEGFDMLGVQLS